MYKLREIRRTLLSMLLPNRCPFCDDIIGAKEYWCEKCYRDLPFLSKMPAAPKHLDGLYSCCDYKDGVRLAIHRMKNGHYSYAPEAFAVLMTELSGDITDRIDVVTSVPCSLRRRLELGYDHTAMIAKDISSRRGYPYRRLMKVTEHKREQKKLNYIQRAENARNSYEILDKKYIEDKNILIVDDVSTTGATLSAAADKLKAAGASRVYALTFAKVRFSRPSAEYFVRITEKAARTYKKER